MHNFAIHYRSCSNMGEDGEYGSRKLAWDQSLGGKARKGAIMH